MLTRCLLADQGHALLPAVDGNDADHVLSPWKQVSKGDGVPWGGHAVLLGPASTMLWVMPDFVARNGGTRSNPVDGERISSYIREVKASGRIKTWVFQRDKRLRSAELLLMFHWAQYHDTARS